MEEALLYKYADAMYDILTVVRKYWPHVYVFEEEKKMLSKHVNIETGFSTQITQTHSYANYDLLSLLLSNVWREKESEIWRNIVKKNF